tara:strand:+ start:156 stop:683 length:528 start_codon:yes stop_codon:yes gene_type:complete
MIMKTDNQDQVGMHVFTRSKLGSAPFRCVGVFQQVGPIVLSDGTQVGSPGQAMGVCAHCGTGIADCYQIKSADGKTFVVGSSCVEKTGDAGLIKSYKNSPEVRAFNKAKRDLLANKKQTELAEILQANKEKLASIQIKKWNGEMESQFEYLTRVIPMCGAAGRARYLKHVKSLVQ